MSNYFATFLLVLLASTPRLSYCQVMYEPQILILSPNRITYDSSLAEEIERANMIMQDRLKLTAAQQDSILQTDAFNKHAENFKTIVAHETAFIRNMDFFRQISMIAEKYLTYRFYNYFPDMFIVLKDLPSTSDLEQLRILSEQENLQYILNFPSIGMYKNMKAVYAKVDVQLYDYQSHALLLDKSYEGDWSNPGFEFACQQRSLHCTLNNVLAQALPEVIRLIALNSPTLQRKRDLYQQRFKTLMEHYYNLPVNQKFVSHIVSPDMKVNPDAFYQCLINDEETKFVAFFLEEVPEQDVNVSKGNRANKDSKEDDSLCKLSHLQAYIVKGVKYNDTWFCEKSNIIAFEAESIEQGRQAYFNNLQQWNFFTDNSTDFSTAFWETELFEKVADLRQDPDWEKYGSNIWRSKEIEDRDYIGLYKIVANRLKKIRREEENSFKDSIAAQIFEPAYEKLKIKNAEFADYTLFNDAFVLIYPQKKNVILNPVLVRNAKGEKALRYFVSLPDDNKFYEWKYLTPKPLPAKTWYYAGEIVDQLEGLTDWNFGLTTLDDQNFWDNYVLLKSGDTFKYLKELE